MHVFIQSSQCPTCFGVGHHYLQARQYHWPKDTAVRRSLVLSSTHRFISLPFTIELFMHSLNVYKFSYRLNVSVRAVLDQLVDINLIDTRGTNNVVKYLLKIYLTVFLPSPYRSSKLTFFKRSPRGYFPRRSVAQSIPITHTTLASNICRSSVWNMLHVTLPAPRILRRLLNFLKIFVSLLRHLSFTLKINQSLYRPWRFQEVEASRFNENPLVKVAKFSALRTGRLYLPGNIPATNFC
jgi:hypothetical protein